MKTFLEFLEESSSPERGRRRLPSRGPSRGNMDSLRQRRETSDRSALKKAGFKRRSTSYPESSEDDASYYHSTQIDTYPNQSDFALNNAIDKNLSTGRVSFGKVKPTAVIVRRLKALRNQLGGDRTPKKVHQVSISSRSAHNKNDSDELISRGKSFRQELRALPSTLSWAAGAKPGDKVVGEPAGVMPHEDRKKGKQRRAKLYKNEFGQKMNPKTGMTIGTFREFLELVEKYYAPDEKLPSGDTPLGKAVKKQEKRESEIGPNSNIRRMNRHAEKIETKVKHGADNPNYNARVNNRDDDEIRVDSDGTDYLTVHHKPSKVTYNVVKQPGPGNIHSIEWSHERGHRKTLLPSERNNISRDARRVWDQHVSHRLPHGATLHNQPAREGLGKIYKRAGFGNVDSDNDQFARVGREKSPKQKAKGKKSRLTPLDPKETKKKANWY